MTTVNWENYPSATTYLSTELNSLASSANKLGAAIDNSTNGKRFIDIEISLAAQSSARSSNARVDIYVLPSIDGTNFTYGDDSTDPPLNTWLASVSFDATTTARRNVTRHHDAPAGQFKMLVMNETGQAFGATGNTVKYVLYSEVNE